MTSYVAEYMRFYAVLRGSAIWYPENGLQNNDVAGMPQPSKNGEIKAFPDLRAYRRGYSEIKFKKPQPRKPRDRLKKVLISRKEARASFGRRSQYLDLAGRR